MLRSYSSGIIEQAKFKLGKVFDKEKRLTMQLENKEKQLKLQLKNM